MVPAGWANGKDLARPSCGVAQFCPKLVVFFGQTDKGDDRNM